MILYVWQFSDDEFRKIAVIDYATSVIWIKRFNSAGEFELYIHASSELLKIFTGDEVILTREDDETTMCVESVRLNTDIENGDYLTVSGRSAESIIGRRIIPKQSNYIGTVENILRTMIDQNIINPTDSSRRISLVELGALNNWQETLRKQVTGQNLLETISDICAAYEYGFKMLFSNGKFVFTLYKGTDRSFNQKSNSYVIFSSEFENLGNTEYLNDKTEHYNSVYVAGEGEGSGRVIVNKNTDKTGLKLRELWVDARNTSSSTEDEQMSASEYIALLIDQAAEEIELAKETITFEGEILDVNMYKCGVDYGLGDKVQIVNEYGISGTAVVTEITEVEDESGYKIYPTLEEWSVE